MSVLNIVNTIVVSLGLPTMVVAAIFVGRKLQILDDLQSTVNKIKSNIKVVSDYLVKNNSTFSPTELQAYSPIKLTQVGNDFIKKIGFDNIFEKHKNDFFRCIDDENPKLKYDVEAAAIKSVSSLYDKDYMELLKVYFYNNPNRNISNTAPTLGIYIRDKYLENHPEITQ